MKNVKRVLGVVWIAMGPAVIIFLLWQAFDKIGISQGQVALATNTVAKEAAQSVVVNTILQWSIIIIVFLPIAFGLMIFGKYALKGEYDYLAKSVED